MSTHKIFASKQTTIPHKSSHQKFNRYLTLSVGAGFVATGQSNAEVVAININATGNPAQSIAGINAGLSDGQIKSINNWPNFSGNKFYLRKSESILNITGLAGYGTQLQFATNGGSNASIKNFASLNEINVGSIFSSNSQASAFKNNYATAANFNANNYVGFRFGNTNNYYYGWLETTWDGTNFQIFSGAYENQVNTAILAGSFVSVPEPGTLTLGSLALLAGGGAAVRRYRKQRQTQSAPISDATEPVTPVA